jgi:hypothetical protein
VPNLLAVVRDRDCPEAVSAPQPGGYPYGAFGAIQRSRDFDDGLGLADLVAEGSDAPLGRG